MRKPTMHPEPYRLAITIDYSDPIKQTIKRLGAKWDPQSRVWWVGNRHPNHDTIRTLLIEYGASIDGNAAGGQYTNCYHRKSHRVA